MRFTLVYWLAALSLFGCGRAHQAHVSKNPVESPVLVELPRRDYTLAVNAMFLWKKSVTARDVSQVSMLGDQFGKAKSAADKNEVIRLMGELMARTDEFESPDFIFIKFDGDVPVITIAGWGTARGKFTSLGGKIEFEMSRGDGKYKFKLSRNRVGVPGIISFYGDLTRTAPDGKKRYGVLKALGRI
jgi:hypothetical protein